MRHFSPNLTAAQMFIQFCCIYTADCSYIGAARGCIGCQGPVVRKIDNAIAFLNTYPLDSDLLSGYIAVSNV